MSDWNNPAIRLVSIEVRAGAARDAQAAPGPAIVSRERHVGVGYQIVLPSGRVVHEGGLTIHGSAGDLELPGELVAAVDALWAHAQQAAAEHEGLSPA